MLGSDVNILCSNLETLDLLGLDKIDGYPLSAIPTKMPKLVYLDLQQCNQVSTIL